MAKGDIKVLVENATGTYDEAIMQDYATDNDIILAGEAMGSQMKAQTMGGSFTRIGGGVVQVDAQCLFVAVWLPKKQTLTGVKWWSTVAGVYTGDAYSGFGLYTYSGGTLTLVASTTTDALLFKATTNTFNAKAFSSTYVADAGLYFVGILWNASATTTAPQLGIMLNTSASILASVDYTNSAKYSGLKTAQAALPTPTVAMSTITASNVTPWVALY